MPKFRKRPVIIEAEQYHGQRIKGVCKCNGERPICTNPLPHIHTIHKGQIVYLEPGDWIIPEPDGEHYYPCKPDIFRATYEEVHGDGIVD